MKDGASIHRATVEMHASSSSVLTSFASMLAPLPKTLSVRLGSKSGLVVQIWTAVWIVSGIVVQSGLVVQI